MSGTERYVQGRNEIYGDGTICPGTERYFQERNDSPGTERYARGWNEGRNGMERDGTRGGTERYRTKSVKIPMRTLYVLFFFFSLHNKQRIVITIVAGLPFIVPFF
jgi:hypothetical protein